MLPIQVHLYNAAQARSNMLSKFKKDMTEKTPKFSMGQYVRISRIKGLFEKGYEGNYLEGILKNFDGLTPTRTFYL